MRVAAPVSVIDAFLDGLVAQLYSMAINPVARVDRIGGMLLVDDPELIETVSRDPILFQKNFAFLSAMGYSRFNTNGEEWLVRRELTQSSYNDAARPQSVASIRQAFSHQLENAGTSPSEIASALYAGSLDVFFRALGCVVDIRQMAEIFSAAREIMKRLQYLSWTGDDPQLQSALEEVGGFFKDLSRRVAGEPGLGWVLQHMQEKASGLHGFAPLEEFTMNFLAGVETSVSTMLWAIDRMADNEKVQQRIYESVAEGGEKPAFLDCFINETMRYFPAIPFVVREVTRDTSLGSMTLQCGESILLSIVGAHQHGRYWKNPAEFQSARREFLEESYDRRAFIPFFLGQRMCGGARLARAEIREALRIFITFYKTERRSDRVKFSYALALRPDAWEEVRIERR